MVSLVKVIDKIIQIISPQWFQVLTKMKVKQTKEPPEIRWLLRPIFGVELTILHLAEPNGSFKLLFRALNLE